MITVNIRTGNEPFYNIGHYICDFESDVASLPTNKSAGSTAKVVETGNLYMLNSQHRWILQPKSSGDGGDNPPEDSTIIYDGGLITESKSKFV